MRISDWSSDVCASDLETYWHWIKRFIVFHGKRHPSLLGRAEAEAFLSSLATDRNVAANTQNLALASILFLYKEVLAEDLPWLSDVTRAKTPKRIPTVLSRQETEALLAEIGRASCGESVCQYV